MFTRLTSCMCLAVFMVVLLVLICSDIVIAQEYSQKDLVVLTANWTSSDAHKRLLRSAKIYEYDIKALGDKGGIIDAATQLQLLKEAVDKYSKGDSKRLILFLDGPDVILQAGGVRVVEEFESSEAGLLISSDGISRVSKELEQDIPRLTEGRRFPDGGAFVGTVEAIRGVFKEFPDEKDLQELLTKAYAKPAIRKKFKIKVDNLSSLFQNLNGATGDLELRFLGKESYLQNTQQSSVPVVIRGRDHTVTILNNFGSYLARAWNEEQGCRDCWDDMKKLENTPDDQLPLVTLAVFIEKPTPFLDEFFDNLKNLSYPRNRMYLFIHNAVEFAAAKTDAWVEKYKEEFKEAKYIPASDSATKEWHAKNGAMDFCLARDCSYVFYVDSDAMMDNPFVIKLLIEQNRNVVSPMLPRPGKAWSNFWGALTLDGFYARSMDYMEIVQNNRRGLWNVPYVGSSFLVKRSLFEEPKTKPSFIANLLDPDMAFCQNLREKGIFMYVSNRVDMGHLLNSENFNPNNRNPELWELFENRWDWEKRYLHENYSTSLNDSVKIQQPCPDVFWFPLFKEKYTDEMIDTMENYGVWSDGSHEDKRLDGGYESVPTVDIHMNQVGYHDEWLEILRAYIQPLQLRVFEGYYNDVGPPKALMAFVVRYKPDEQPNLRPHHDTSTYTINVALNRAKIDYEGGGCRFIRYNCSVVDTRKGWVLMHPGRLTHLHEGLYVTKGTRYIVVTFVDP